MIKLNGNIYLTEDETEKYVYDISSKFTTSHRAMLPRQIVYLDVDFVSDIRDEAKETSLSLFYLYGYGELHAPVRKIIDAIAERKRPPSSCTEKLYFMQYDLSDTQRKKYRIQYGNYLINIFLEECILKFKKLS
tara:strand:+ start:27819 stop:28220 length:402 start_codon:yes stop_codon:yes gene_type:complete